MKFFPKFLITTFILIDILLVGLVFLRGDNFAVLNPAGTIASQERILLFVAIGLMMIGAIPVFSMAIYVAFTYHAKNAKATYQPDWDQDKKLQVFWWTFLIVIVISLSIINWIFTHRLDPRNGIASEHKTMVVQVVALRWKWLFIYPAERIATVNYLEIPAQTPIQFELTADAAPMNSFWIPQLGGQIYAMAGMTTQTHLMSDTTGSYYGRNSEINGIGFAEMQFLVKSVNSQDFKTWVSQVQQTQPQLSWHSYDKLAQPSEHYPVSFYSSTPDHLYTTIIMKYMSPAASSAPNNMQTQSDMSGMHM